ncbi:MAG TPA: type II secretion system protein [Thermoanaerobaculia bacterium]|nr:type II secretion system protein [Thermoanaerobaculia bacterium]
MQRGRREGFSIIELLIVLGIISILSAIVIANYLTGLQRARQKRTMADIRNAATAWEARAVEIRAYNAAGFTYPTQPVTISQLMAILVPTYTKVLPRADGWGKDLEFTIDKPFAGTEDASYYAIRSAGSDSTFESPPYTPGATTQFECDIVYSAGQFVVYPASK